MVGLMSLVILPFSTIAIWSSGSLIVQCGLGVLGYHFQQHSPDFHGLSLHFRVEDWGYVLKGGFISYC